MTPTAIIVPSCIYCGPDCPVGYGFCHCKCGGEAKICTMTSRKFGVVKGKPCRYILGHQGRIRPQIEEAGPFKIEGVYCRLIPLSRGLYAIVDEADYRWLMQWKWMAHWDEKGQCFYAWRHGTRVKGKGPSLWMHRVILGMALEDTRRGDHSNHNTLDNRRNNIRPASLFENAQNMEKPCTNKSGYKGVSFHKATGKWIAQINVNGKKKYLGIYSTPELAYAAYCKAALEYHGEFACLG